MLTNESRPEAVTQPRLPGPLLDAWNYLRVGLEHSGLTQFTGNLGASVRALDSRPCHEAVET